MSAPRQAIDILNAAFSDKYNSMAQYVLEAQPYTGMGGTKAMETLAALAAEDRDLSDRLAQAIERLEGIPQVTTYDPSVAHLNYLSLEYLLGVLTETLERQLARSEAGLVEVEAIPVARKALAEVCATTRSQLERLRALR